MSSDGVHCGQCKTALNEQENTPKDQRSPCPSCGSTTRRNSAHLSGSLVARGGLGIKARHAGEKRPFHESYGGPDYSVSRGKHVRKTRIIDRDEDKYLEHIEDFETGEVVHHADERLSEHRGHGSAKNKKGI